MKKVSESKIVLTHEEFENFMNNIKEFVQKANAENANAFSAKSKISILDAHIASLTKAKK